MTSITRHSYILVQNLHNLIALTTMVTFLKWTMFTKFDNFLNAMTNMMYETDPTEIWECTYTPVCFDICPYTIQS